MNPVLDVSSYCRYRFIRMDEETLALVLPTDVNDQIIAEIKTGKKIKVQLANPATVGAIQPGQIDVVFLDGSPAPFSMQVSIRDFEDGKLPRPNTLKNVTVCRMDGAGRAVLPPLFTIPAETDIQVWIDESGLIQTIDSADFTLIMPVEAGAA